MTSKEFLEINRKLAETSEEYASRYFPHYFDKDMIKNAFNAGYRTALTEVRKLDFEKTKEEK